MAAWPVLFFLSAGATSAFYVRRKPMSATINTLANALYKVRLLALRCCVAQPTCAAVAFRVSAYRCGMLIAHAHA